MFSTCSHLAYSAATGKNCSSIWQCLWHTHTHRWIHSTGSLCNDFIFDQLRVFLLSCSGLWRYGSAVEWQMEGEVLLWDGRWGLGQQSARLIEETHKDIPHKLARLPPHRYLYLLTHFSLRHCSSSLLSLPSSSPVSCLSFFPSQCEGI